ncbi:MAG: hypothetical protein ACI9NC_003523 [Verrucomicrobiales bacterium]|jgi:hypothetical protein
MLELSGSISLSRNITQMDGGTVAGIGTSTSNGILSIDAAATGVTGDVTLSGDPTFAVEDRASANGRLTTGSLVGGGVARVITKT